MKATVVGMARWLTVVCVGLGLSSVALADVAPGGGCRCATVAGGDALGAAWLLVVVAAAVVTLRKR